MQLAKEPYFKLKIFNPEQFEEVLAGGIRHSA